ncbi:hypothetical protein ACFYY1_35580 [Streptomyces sp. NPDC001890]|uniref:hypothetical protein n=1 Tax=Streptomyces sp. NPDC001890 TaxID=3364620 RepID=UPI00367B1B4C
MKITIDTRTESYTEALTRLRQAYEQPRADRRPPIPYAGKFVLEPPSPACFKPVGDSEHPER